jgi:Demerecviridae HNH endonuclease
MITQNELKRLLNYDPATGVWTWRVWRGGGAPRAGEVAGHINGQGYREIKLRPKTYQVGRLVFLWMTGKWPKREVDHINGDQADNRWCNLREATEQQQCRNRRGWSKHGFKGIRARKGGFEAVITINHKRTYLGRRQTAAAAHELYCIAAAKHFGAFARADHIET